MPTYVQGKKNNNYYSNELIGSIHLESNKTMSINQKSSTLLCKT